MKVLLVNGSPHEKGCTYTALKEIAEVLNHEEIETEIFQVGKQPLTGCIACWNCSKTGKCVFDDCVNEFLQLAENFDGFIFGSPVHFASASGSISPFMDRAFFVVNCSERKTFYLKPGAAIVSTRRAGATAALDQLNKYFTKMEMPVISSRYWNMVHGNTPDEVKEDLEGLQIMRILGRNMAWFLKCKEAGEKAGIAFPEKEVRISTNFIRYEE